jgi:hypothetical protein
MRTELKVYLSHTDAARIQKAAQAVDMSVSAYMRRVCLLYADALGVSRLESLLDRQLPFPQMIEVVREG